MSVVVCRSIDSRMIHLTYRNQSQYALDEQAQYLVSPQRWAAASMENMGESESIHQRQCWHLALEIYKPSCDIICEPLTNILKFCAQTKEYFSSLLRYSMPFQSPSAKI